MTSRTAPPGRYRIRRKDSFRHATGYPPGRSAPARAKSMLSGVVCKFDPDMRHLPLLNTAAQQDLMKYFLLAKMGYVSVFTIWDKMGIMNYRRPGAQRPEADEIG